MSLQYKQSFQGLRIVGLPPDRCHATKGDLVRVYFQLSAPPPLGWAYIFTSVWRSLAYPVKRQTGVDGDAVWIDCIPDELAAIHREQLDYAIAQTNVIYQNKAQAQAREAEREKQLQAELRLKLELLSHTLYPAAAPRVEKGSLMARLFRYVCGRGTEKDPLPGGQAAVAAPVENRRDYHHGRFDGAAIAADGHSLQLDYFDHDQGGTRFRYRYVVSLHAPPRLISGFIHEDSRLDYEIPFERIPHHVISDAQDWLAAEMKVNRDEPLTNTLSALLNYLREHENSSCGGGRSILEPVAGEGGG